MSPRMSECRKSASDEASTALERAFERHKLGYVEDARRVYEQILRAFPTHPVALHYLALTAQQAGDGYRAEQLLRRSIALKGDDPRAHNHLGQILAAQNRHSEAEASFHASLLLDPKSEAALINLANIFKSRGDLDAAEALYRRAIDSNPLSSDAAFNLANTLKLKGRFGEAVACFESAVSTNTSNYQAHQNLAVLLEELGRFDDAVVHYRKALDIRPLYVKAMAGLMASNASSPSSKMIRQAQGMLDGKRLTTDERINLHYGLGKYYDRQNEPGPAFKHFVLCNRLTERVSGSFDRKMFERYIDEIVCTFREAYFANQADVDDPGAQLIFVVGMPRSGTTLAEQILSSHSKVAGAGELQSMVEVAQSIAGYPKGAIGLGDNDRRMLAQSYRAAALSAAPRSAAVIIDKLPMNFLHLGLIASLYPRCKVVHCVRDPMDVGLSCFMHRFHLKHDFTNRLESFGSYYMQYRRLMEHWRKVLPIPIYEQRYEAVVKEAASSVRNLLEYCELEFEPACLEAERTDRPVLTPSRWQVRQPIYTSSVGRWRRYEAEMQPLVRYFDSNGMKYA